jgi:tetratricopeptide (TPR) repeat protein
MKKNSGFGDAIEIYLRKVASRSPLPWPVFGIGIIILMFAASMIYKADSVVSAQSSADVVVMASRRGDYQTARNMWDGSMNNIEDLVYPERKIEQKIGELEAKLGVYPENREIYLLLANLYSQLNDVERSSRYLELARILSPND